MWYLNENNQLREGVEESRVEGEERREKSEGGEKREGRGEVGYPVAFLIKVNGPHIGRIRVHVVVHRSKLDSLVGRDKIFPAHSQIRHKSGKRR